MKSLGAVLLLLAGALAGCRSGPQPAPVPQPATGLEELTIISRGLE